MHNCPRHDTMGSGPCPLCAAEADAIRAKAAPPDQLNKSQEIRAVKEEPYVIPTRAEHKKRTRRIWMLCICFSLFVLVSMGGTVLILVSKDQDIHRIVAITTVTFQVIIGMFATGFTTPLFLEQRLNFVLGLEMSRRGLDITDRMSGTLEKVDRAIDQRLVRVDKLLDSAEKAATQFEKGDGPLIKMFKDEMQKLRQSITEKKTETETELDEALAEGEREAAEIERGGKPTAP